jgi:protein phosphatase 2C family protein 2/3
MRQNYNSGTSSASSCGSAGSGDMVGPLRVLPGRLSVSRTFGDIEAKLKRFGGNPNVVVCVPEIKAFKIDESQHDFIVLGCDGIFDRLSNRDSV